jgi:hypothetical protein
MQDQLCGVLRQLASGTRPDSEATIVLTAMKKRREVWQKYVGGEEVEER